MENTELVKAEPPAAHPGRLVVAAENPSELQQSQEKIIVWARAKVENEKKELADLKENLDVAVKNKWRTSTLRRLLSKQEKRIEYYEKILAALEAGYYIIPDWQLEIFAIRTSRKNVRQNLIHGSRWDQPRDQETNVPALGEGRYVSPTAAVEAQQADISKPEEKPGTRMVTQKWATKFQDVDFPFLTTAKPQVIHATADAMKKMIFDELGVAPARPKADPIVVGKVCSPDRLYGTRKAVYFMVAWFLDTDTL